MFQAVKRIQTSLQQHKYFSNVGRKDAAPFMTHTRNKYIFLKDIHIQNDENVFFWFIYLIFIYFYKIKKKNMKQKANKSARIWEGKGKKPSNKQGLQYLCFFLYVQDKFLHLNFF